MNAILVLVLAGIEQGIALYNKLREKALQDAELTPEEVAAHDQKLKDMFNQPHWQ